MATKANFEVIWFYQHLGDNDGDLPTNAQWEGDATSERVFHIEGRPTGTGYITLQVYDVEQNDHQIKINGRFLPGYDIRPSGTKTWATWTDVIEHDVLRQGRNTIQIVRNRSDHDNFIIDNVIVHWKEQG